MIQVSIEVDASAFAKVFAKLTTGKIKKALVKVGGFYLMLQRQNIENGVTPDGAQFEQYKPAYLVQRMRAERGSYGWLRLTGDMLKSQRVKVTTGGPSVNLLVEFEGSRLGDVFHVKTKLKAKEHHSYSMDLQGVSKKTTYTNNQRKAGSNSPMVVARTGKTVKNDDIASGNDALRPFVGVSDQTIDELIKMFLDALGLDIV